MSTKTAMALCFSLAYIVALVGVAASLIRKPPRKPWGPNQTAKRRSASA